MDMDGILPWRLILKDPLQSRGERAGEKWRLGTSFSIYGSRSMLFVLFGPRGFHYRALPWEHAVVVILILLENFSRAVKVIYA